MRQIDLKTITQFVYLRKIEMMKIQYEMKVVPLSIELRNARKSSRDLILAIIRFTFMGLADEKLEQSQFNIIVPLEKVVESVNPHIIYLSRLQSGP